MYQCNLNIQQVQLKKMEGKNKNQNQDDQNQHLTPEPKQKDQDRMMNTNRINNMDLKDASELAKQLKPDTLLPKKHQLVSHL